MKRFTRFALAALLPAALAATLAWYYDVYVNWQPAVYPFALVTVTIGIAALTLFLLRARGEIKRKVLLWKTLLSAAVFSGVILFGVSFLINNVIGGGNMARLAAAVALPLAVVHIFILCALLFIALRKREFRKSAWALLSSITTILLVLLAAVIPLYGHMMRPMGMAGQNDPAILKFKQDGSFKIIQVTDLHVRTPARVPITREFLYDLAKKEQPDLFVLTGDNTWGTGGGGRSMFRRNIGAFMHMFDEIYRDFGIPVTMVFGNHDTEGGPFSREEAFEFYAAHESFIGYACGADEGASDKLGPYYGTHNLVVMDRAGNIPVFNIWLFDSGSNIEAGWDGSLNCVRRPQIDWFNSTNEAMGYLPSIAFQHIVVPEIYDLLTPASAQDEDTFHKEFLGADGGSCEKYVSKTLPEGAKGELRENPCPPTAANDGQYAALCEAGNVLALFFGHEHVNTFELRIEGKTDLVNTPVSGFESYGDIDLRGVRVITLREDNLADYSTWCVSYQSFYGGDALRQARLEMYQRMGNQAAVRDALSYKPLLWVIRLFGK